MAYEDLSELIDHAIRNFTIKPDRQAAARIKECTLDTEEIRKLRLEEADSSLREISVQLQLLESRYQKTVEVHDACKHSAEMDKLANEELRIAKEASYIEKENYQLEKQLRELQKELSDLESQGVEGDESTRQSRENEDPLLLRLKIYRTLPIDPLFDEAGILNKVVISNRRDEVDVIHIDSGLHPSHFFGGLQDAQLLSSKIYDSYPQSSLSTFQYF